MYDCTTNKIVDAEKSDFSGFCSTDNFSHGYKELVWFG